MAFHEQWFGKPKRAALQLFLEMTTAKTGYVVEVGSWEGRSTIQIAKHFGCCHAIDHWKGDLTDPKSNVASIAAKRDVFADFQANVKQAGVDVKVIRGDWREVDWKALDPLRFLFIDGQHTYAEVADNIKVALPLMADGSVMAGDDYSTAQVRQALADTLGRNIVTNGMIWACRF